MFEGFPIEHVSDDSPRSTNGELLTASITGFTAAGSLRGSPHCGSHCTGIDFGNLEECDVKGCLRVCDCETAFDV
jgi:hypothetical protein